MSDSPNPDDTPEPADADHAPERPGRRQRHAGRTAIVVVVSVFLLISAGIWGTYAAVNHLVGNIRRIPDVFSGLNEAARPVMPAATRGSMTVLLTGSAVTPAVTTGGNEDHASQAAELPSGLVMLLHLDANQHSGSVVSLPPNAVVTVPGHASAQIENTLKMGGPRLLIETVESVTNVRIDHYAVIDFSHVNSLIDALGGVEVLLAQPVRSHGITFHAGLNHLTGATALAYVRQPADVLDGEAGRVRRQQALARAIVDKIAQHRLLGNPVTEYRLLNAFTGALSVDSNFTTAEIRALLLRLRSVADANGTFVTAPTRVSTAPGANHAVVFASPASTQLWSAIRNDSVAAFAAEYPQTVTPAPPG